MECNKFFGVNLLKGEYFRPEFNNNNSKLLATCVFIEIIITYCEACINDMVGSYDVIATFTLRGVNKRKVSTSEAINQGVGQI
jgi:thymidine kinase